jgi:hypothetical protein
MKSIVQMIMQSLLEKYDDSKHRKGEAKINRGIYFSITEHTVPDYFVDGLKNKRSVINQELKYLEQKGYIHIQWYDPDILISSVSLNLAKVSDAYALVGRSPLNQEIDALKILFAHLKTSFYTPWIQSFIDHILTLLNKQELPNNLKVKETLDLLIKTLEGIERKGSEVLPERLFSKRYLGNSKRFEKQVRSKLISIYKIYGDPSATEWDDEYILEELGIVKSVEEIQLRGHLKYRIEDSLVDFGGFQYGASLNSESIRAGAVHGISAVRIVIIENKTVFREFLRKEACMDDLVIYVGGFPGPDKRLFFQQIHNWTSKQHSDKKFLFWGDIDVGGFHIYHHLLSVMPKLHPFRMDRATLLAHLQWVEEADKNYLKKIKKMLNEKRFSMFHSVMEIMLHEKIRFEQEGYYL